MPVFRYRAIDRAGEVVTGTMTEGDREAVARRLQAQGQLPIRIEGGAAAGLRALLDTEITPRDALSATDRVVFTRALATLTGAGLPIDRALSMVESLGVSRGVRALAGRLEDAVRGGSTLADALDRETAAFPPLYRAVVRAGEVGASLETTLARLADMLETGAKRRGALVSALIYPAFLVVTSIGAVAILLGFVVPSFKPLMDEAGVDPPAITSAVIAVGGFVESWWAVMIAALAALVLIARLALARPRLRLAWHRTALALPVLGTLWAKFETARLTRLLGTLLQNGVALPAAMKLTRGALSNHAFMAEMDRVIPEVEAGRGVAAPFAEGGLLPALARQLIQVGQESGQLTAMLLKAADIFDEEARRDFDRLLSLVTPLLTLVMGGVVAVIISSILLALLSINDLAI